MERKIAHLLVLTGVTISALVALTPLTSYADASKHGYDCDPKNPSTLVNADGDGVADFATNGCAATTSNPQEVSVKILDYITLDTASGTTINVASNFTGTGDISATVTSAKDYTILLSAEEPRLIKTDNEVMGIPSRDFATDAKMNAWGIKKYNTDGTKAENYSAVTYQPTVFYEGTASDDAQTTEFEMGVVVTEATEAGTYQTDLTVTAAVKE